MLRVKKIIGFFCTNRYQFGPDFSILILTNGSGKGALTLWPLFWSDESVAGRFGASTCDRLSRKKKVSIVYTFIPMVFMIFKTGWAMLLNLNGYYAKADWLLFCIGLSTIILEVWMIIESFAVLKNVYGGAESPVKA